MTVQKVKSSGGWAVRHVVHDCGIGGVSQLCFCICHGNHLGGDILLRLIKVNGTGDIAISGIPRSCQARVHGIDFLDPEFIE